MLEDDVKQVGEFLHRAVQTALVLQKEAGSKLLKDFVRYNKPYSLFCAQAAHVLFRVATEGGEGFEGRKQVQELKKDVQTFARKWPLPGVDVSNIKRPAGISEDD
jgi:glycine hydroxymethyltransferase